MVTVGQAGRIPVSLSLLLNHDTILKYLQLWDFWRQTSGEKQMGLWVLMLKVKTTKNNAEPSDVCCYCAVIVVSFTVLFACVSLFAPGQGHLATQFIITITQNVFFARCTVYVQLLFQLILQKNRICFSTAVLICILLVSLTTSQL